MPTPSCGYEFIRGNRDGAHGTSATYTLCRLSVPRAQLIRELEEEGLHPNYRVLHKRNPEGEVIDAWPQNTPDGITFTNINHGDVPKRCPAERLVAISPERAGAGVPQTRLSGAGPRLVEYVHGHRDGKGGRNEHYTICRLGVPADTVEWEVREGLHPDFEAVHRGRHTEIGSKNDPLPELRCGMVCELAR